MNNFCIITNECKDKGLRITKRLMEYILKKGGTATAFQCSEQKEPRIAVRDIPQDTQVILVLGGDGTLIRVATQVEDIGIPMLGINLGTLGYLCELEVDQIHTAIDRLMADEFMVEERMMLGGIGEDGKRLCTALNDIVIHRMGNLSILRLKVYVNGEYLCTYNADGVIVATPTGSTGYNMSAGGAIVEPKAKLLLLTPINAHSLGARGIVLDADDFVEIEIDCRRAQKDERAGVVCDGDFIMTMGVGERFAITRAANTIKICKLNKESFLEIMRKKMED